MNLSFQALLSQNLLLLLAAELVVLSVVRRFRCEVGPSAIPTHEISTFLAALTLVFIGFAAGIQVNNIGRVLSILAPVSALLIVKNLALICHATTNIKS